MRNGLVMMLVAGFVGYAALAFILFDLDWIARSARECPGLLEDGVSWADCRSENRWMIFHRMLFIVCLAWGFVMGKFAK